LSTASLLAEVFNEEISVSFLFLVCIRFNYSYFYDPADRITSVRNNDTNQETKRSYTSLGDLASETLETGLTTHYDYDKLGRVSTLTLPDNSKIHYHYNLFLKSISRNDWTYEVAKRDQSGNILSSKLPKEAGTLDFSYDSLNRKTKISHPAYNQELCKFDQVGNLLEMKINDALTTYSYNHRYQLQSENDKSYAYNAVHNRLSHTTNAIHSILHDGKREFAYDKRGNRTRMDDTYYSYDGQDRLIKVTTPSEKVSYSYDPFNRRLEKKSDTCHERYLYIGQNEIGVVDDTGKITQLRILGEGLGAEIGAAVALELGSKLYIPIHDHRGNVSTLLDPQGDTVESYRYDAFGVEEQPSMLNPWRFSSKRVDPETELVYFGRRYYDPSLGSWLTKDPLGPDAGPNLYAYVRNNPMMYFDLYGLYPARSDGVPCYRPENLNTKQDYRHFGCQFRYSSTMKDNGCSRIISASLVLQIKSFSSYF
jgi:RHS repeat-associated protein